MTCDLQHFPSAAVRAALGRHANCSRLVLVFLLAAGGLGIRRGGADEAYFRVSLAQWNQPVMNLAPADDAERAEVPRRSRLKPRVWLDHEGEVVVRGPDELFAQTRDLGSWELLARIPADRDLSGQLFTSDARGRPLPPVRITVPRQQASRDARELYWQTQLEHYDRLGQRSPPGAAWLRHQAMRAADQLAILRSPTDTTPPRRPANIGDSQRAFDLFTGQRALAENLSLDQPLANLHGGKPTVAADALRGITIAAIDWKPLLPAHAPELDPLADLLPADQHALFIPSFPAFVRLTDELKSVGISLGNVLAVSGQQSDVLSRYERQLGVSLQTAARLLGKALVRSVAITGGDPYFEVGTDVAIVLESPEPQLLRDAVLAAMRAAAASQTGADFQEGVVDGLSYQGFATPDRLVSGYVAQLRQAVVITNSLQQLHQLAKVGRKPTTALSQLDEYHYFRHRYGRKSTNELALLFISDATIRRWCGPRWRIGTLRRTRALAEIAELQSQQVDELVAGLRRNQPLAVEHATIELGPVTSGPHGVRSATYGGIAFATPIGELPLDLVTSLEAEAYERWRVGYERNWRWAFDPIGLQLSLDGPKLSADLTILPLIANTSYQPLIDLTRGTSIPAIAGDPHNAILHAVLALNANGSQWLALAEGFAQSYFKTEIKSWLGPTLSVCIDDSPLWDEVHALLVKQGGVRDPSWAEPLAERLPVAVVVDVTDRDKAENFLSAMRSYIDQNHPNQSPPQWTQLEYRGQTYTRLVQRNSPVQRFVVHVALLEKVLILAVTEDVLKRSIDRHLDRTATPADAVVRAAEQAASQRWTGRNAVLDLDERAIAATSELFSYSDVLRIQQLSWDNLPILNEWKLRYPDQDPVQVHQRIWNVRLVCPAGGKYVWNDESKTMESTAVGHPAQPRLPPRDELAKTARFKRAFFGLTFEQRGLRAEATLERQP